LQNYTFASSTYQGKISEKAFSYIRLYEVNEHFELILYANRAQIGSNREYKNNCASSSLEEIKNKYIIVRTNKKSEKPIKILG